MFWLLEAIELFIWRCLRWHAFEMLALHKAERARRHKIPADVARWRARQQKRALRDAGRFLKLLKATQGRLGSGEIEPAITA